VAQNLELEKNSRKRLFLTIAFACNVGGMLVPIASPQNIVAIAAAEDTGIAFADWFVFSLPVCLCTLVVIFFVLRHQYGESSSLVNRPTQLVEMGGTPPASPASGSEWSWQQIVVCLILVSTVTGWCMFEYLKDIFGHMGIFGSVGVVVLHASGLLTSADWQGLPWPVLTLMGGGIVLGEAVRESGLLSVISDCITSLFPTGSSPWVVFLLFEVILCFVANFLSSTVCALISVPIIAKIGSVFGHSKLFVIGSTLMISAAMCLPISSFPNANSAAVMEKSKPLLRVSDFTKTGFSIGIFFLIYMVTVGYWTGLALNH
jgi:phosphate transporter